MATCPPLAVEGAFLSSLLRHIDCQGQSIGASGYQALADPGSPISIALTGVLTVFVAVFGIRMILGSTPGLREGVMAVVKIGAVLLIAGSWPAYRTVVYDVVVAGPGQLAGTIGRASGLPGADGDLVSRLHHVDEGVRRLTTLGSGRNDLTSRSPTGPGGSPVEPERTPVADDLAFGAARVAFLSGVVGAFVLVRLGAGVLLTLAPLFAALLLFDLARGIFAGWLRALVFTMLASIAATILLGVELALLEPWLAHILGLRHARVITAQAPVELLVLCLGFTAALVGAFGLLLRLAFAVQVQLNVGETLQARQREGAALPASRASLEAAAAGSSRAAAVARAVGAVQRREGSVLSPRTALRLRSAYAPVGGAPAPLGRAGPTSRRRTKPRKSLASALRDRRS